MPHLAKTNVFINHIILCWSLNMTPSSKPVPGKHLAGVWTLLQTQQDYRALISTKYPLIQPPWAHMACWWVSPLSSSGYAVLRSHQSQSGYELIVQALSISGVEELWPAVSMFTPWSLQSQYATFICPPRNMGGEKVKGMENGPCQWTGQHILVESTWPLESQISMFADQFHHLLAMLSWAIIISWSP